MMRHASSSLRTLAWAACIFAFVLVAFGAFVRLSNAGLSCPDWPTCYGEITWPTDSASVARADQAFPHRPVEIHRAWREQTHRFLAGTLGVLVLVQALVAAFPAKRRLGLILAAVILIGLGIPLYMAKSYVAASVVGALGELILLALFIFWRRGGWRRITVLTLAVVCFQALLGMWTVTWLLLPAVVVAHLLGGVATFALLAWIACWLGLPKPVVVGREALVTATVIGLILLSGQIFLGGWTSVNYAGLACGIGSAAFPECLGQWWPHMNFHAGFVLLRPVGVDYQGGILDGAARTAIQVVHRMGAVVVFFYSLWLAYAAGRAGLRWHGAILVLVVMTQVALGVANVTLGLPLWVAEAHTAGAVLLLFVLVALLARIWHHPHVTPAVHLE